MSDETFQDREGGSGAATIVLGDLRGADESSLSRIEAAIGQLERNIVDAPQDQRSAIVATVKPKEARRLRDDRRRWFGEGFKDARAQAAEICRAMATRLDIRTDEDRAAGQRPSSLVRSLRNASNRIRNMSTPNTFVLALEAALEGAPVTPCDVRLPSATLIKAGCRIDTLAAALAMPGRPTKFGVAYAGVELVIRPEDQSDPSPIMSDVANRRLDNDAITGGGIMSLDEREAEMSRLRVDLARAGEDLAEAKLAGNTKRKKEIGLHILVLNQRLSAARKLQHEYAAKAEVDRFRRAARELLDPDTYKSIVTRASEGVAQ